MTTEDRKVQLGVSVDATEAEQGFAKIVAGGRNMADKVSKAGSEAAAGIDAVGDGAQAAAVKYEKATSQIMQAIQRRMAREEAAGKSASAFYESLANQRGANLDVLKPHLAQLDAVIQKQMDAKIALAQGTAGLNEMGISAKATAAAMRGVPAQFTDIITSLQGGQAPLTVFLQQGGQLKDMFGGAGNAARALGGYVLGLVNPFTIAAAAVAGIAVAYNQGAKEADAYRAALVTTGNAAGTNAAQLKSYAQEISSVVGTQGKAAEALSALAATGKVGAENLREAAQAAVAYERATGQAASKTAEQFASLRNEPLSAVLKLNEGMNFLTDSTYKQIKSLEEQGKTAEAANVAQRAFADTLSGRAGEMERNLGTVERGWLAVKDAAKSAWDAILNVGRASTSVDQLAEVRKQIAQRENQIANGGFGTNEGGAAFGRPSQAATERLKAELAGLQAQAAALEGVANQSRVAAEEERTRTEAVKARAAADKEGLKYLDERRRMLRQIDQESASIRGAYAGKEDAESLAAMNKELRERERLIRDSYAKKGGSKSKEGDPFAADREYAKEYAKAWEDFTKIGEDAAGKTDDLSKAQARLVDYLKSPAYANHNAAMRETVLQSAYAAIAAEKLAAEHKKEAAALKESADAAFANSEAIHKTMVATEDKLKAQTQENETIGMTAVQIAQLVKARDLEAAAALDAKAALYEQAGAREEDIDGIKRTAAALRKLAGARLDSAVKKQELSDWTTFFTGIDNAARQVWTNVLQGGQDIWSKLRNTAKTIFFDWLYQMTVKKWIFSIGATVSGSGAMAQTASGGAPGIGDLAKMFKSGGSSWFTDFGGSLAGSVSDFGTTLVDKGFTSFGTKLEGIGLDMGKFSDVINGAGNALGYFNSALLASQGKWGASIGSAIGTYFGGPLGSIIGQTVGSWVDKLTGNTGTKPSIEGGFSTSGNPGTNGRAYTDTVGGQQYGGALDATAKGYVTGVAADFATIVAAAGKQAAALTSQAFIGIDGNGGSKGSQNKFDFAAFLGGKQIYNRAVDLGTNNAGNTDAALSDAAKESTAKAVLAALAETDLGPQLNKYLDTVKINGASLAEVTASLGDVTSFIAFNEAVKNLPFDYLTDVSVEATKALIAAAGGLDKLGEDISNYFELFGTEAEKKSALVGNLSTAFDKLGITLPQSAEGLRDWYKSEVKRLGAMDLSIEANAKAYDSVLKLAGGIDQISKAEEQAAATRQSWQDQLDVLTGKTTDTAQQLKRDLASTTDESTKAIIRQVYAEKERKKAIEDQTAAQVAALAKITTAYTATAAAQKSAIQTQLDAAGSVKALLASLQVGTNAATSPQSRLEAARSQYLADLSASRAGDFAAYSRVSTTAQNYIGAGSEMYASSAEQKAIIAQVQSELANLPAVAKYDENLAALNRIESAIKAASVNTVDAINADKVDTLQAIHAMTLATTQGFDSFDANQSGTLDFTELRNALGVGDRLTQELINAIDTNGDGQISRLEVIAANTSGLAELDRINATINQFDWSDANKPAAIAGFSNIAKQNNWSVAQIAAASGYSTSEISRLFAGTGLGTGVGGSPTSVSEQIDAAIKQYDWSDAAKQASAAAFANVASSKGWSIGQISGVSGYGAADLSKLFAGTALGAGIAGTGSSASASTSTAAATAPNYAVIAGIVNSMNWADGNKNASATASYALSLASGWTQQMIAAATGNSFPSIQALFASAGIPNFETGGDHTGGLRLVGERGPELEVTGPSRIFNASQTAAMLNGGNNQALIDEVRELRKEVAKGSQDGAPIHITVVSQDGKKLAEQVIRTIKERSRNREVVIYADGVSGATR